MPPTVSDTDIPNASETLTRLYPPSDRTLSVLLKRQAEKYGTKPLTVVGERVLTFGEAPARAAQFAGLLECAGVRRGDRVAVLCGNRMEFLDLFIGSGWLGAIAVPINTALRGVQLEHILRSSGAAILVVEPEYLGHIRKLDRPTLPIRSIWVLDGVDEDEDCTWPISRLPEPGGEIPAAETRPSDPVAILYTSGTTGLSKGVCCPHAQYFWWGVNSASLLGIREKDVLLTCLPLFHTNALNAFYQALLTGATLVVEPRFSATAFWKSLTEHKATVTYLLGAMVPILLSKPKGDYDSAHKVRIALAPGVPAKFHAVFSDRFGLGILDGYGSTETNFVIGSAMCDQRPGWMGREKAEFEARVVDEFDNEQADGQPGELVIRAKEPFSIFTGYFGMPEKTVEAWRNLWFHTGDCVVRDANGYFRFIDRMKDSIRRRGENISSFEVEQVLVAHPAVENAAVYPVSSEMAEDEIMAAVVLHPGAALTAVELLDFCRGRIAYFAIPRYVRFVPSLPTTENGKVQKYRLRELGVTDGTWDREAAGYEVTRD